MSEPTDVELIRAMYRGLTAVKEIVRAAEQRGRLAGWNECREACKKEAKKPRWIDYTMTVSWPRSADEIADAIAALTPTTK